MGIETIAFNGTNDASGSPIQTIVSATNPLPVSASFTAAATSSVQGIALSGTAVSGAPVLVGARAATADPTAVANGQAVDIMTDKIGRFINAGFAIPENNIEGSVTSTATAVATIIASPGTGLALSITDLMFSNTGGVDTKVTINNGASFAFAVPGTLSFGGREVHVKTPIKLAANTALTFTMTPATTLIANALGFKGV